MGTPAVIRFYDGGKEVVTLYKPLCGGMDDFGSVGPSLIAFMVNMEIADRQPALEMRHGFGERALCPADLAAQLLLLLKDGDAAGDIFIDPTGKRDYIAPPSYEYSIFCDGDTTPVIVVSQHEPGIGLVEMHRGFARELLTRLGLGSNPEPVPDLVEKVRSRLAFLSSFMGDLGLHAHPSDQDNEIVEIHANGVPLAQIAISANHFCVEELVHMPATCDDPPGMTEISHAVVDTLHEAIRSVIGLIAGMGLSEYHLVEA